MSVSLFIGVSEACSNVVLSEVGKVIENFLVRHPRSQIRKDIENGDPHSRMQGFPQRLPGSTVMSDRRFDFIESSEESH